MVHHIHDGNLLLEPIHVLDLPLGNGLHGMDTARRLVLRLANIA